MLPTGVMPALATMSITVPYTPGTQLQPTRIQITCTFQSKSILTMQAKTSITCPIPSHFLTGIGPFDGHRRRGLLSAVFDPCGVVGP